MERTLEDPRPSNLDEDKTNERLNDACLLSDTELSFDERGSSYDFSNLVVPETPER